MVGVGSTVASESALRSSGTHLSRVRVPSSAPWPDGVPKSLRSPCCSGHAHHSRHAHSSKHGPKKATPTAARELAKRSDKEVNVQIFKTAEEIRAVERHLMRLRQQLARNESRY
ncbi:hypothetical protein PoB_004228400 [Plakobranchus ocellatus]|uniref:Uncharacterized protein n=1 Tax=Plakobranchus ocellatus TaxID=259542 RepID=A0AAV4BBP1_9GAST|nr:hypothetical protein PoB_004228400 [Plakobranchus ocellatus]